MKRKLRIHTRLVHGGLLFFASVVIFPAYAQDSAWKSPEVVRSFHRHLTDARQDSMLQMVELKSWMPRLLYDLRYGTRNNFMQRPMYRPAPRHTFLRRPAARALQQAAAELGRLGYGLKIFDAYRPYSVTVAFWELVKDERYVAHPARGSGHNRGLAVDLTLTDLATGRELEMGTGFDNFSDTAHHGFSRLSDEILQRRTLLKQTMEKVGFRALETEWWHYAWPNDGRYPLLDIPFRQLKRAAHD